MTSSCNEGELKDDKIHGKGNRSGVSGADYEGEYIDDKRKLFFYLILVDMLVIIYWYHNFNHIYTFDITKVQTYYILGRLKYLDYYSYFSLSTLFFFCFMKWSTSLFF